MSVMNFSPKCIPQDNMDCYYNSLWRQSQTLPVGSPEINNFTIIQEQIDKYFYQMILQAEKGPDPMWNKMVDMRDSYLERTDGSPILELIVACIKRINSVQTLGPVLNLLTWIGVPTLFTLGVGPNYQSPNVYIVCIGDVALTLESKEFYERSEREHLEAYASFLEEVYQLVSTQWSYNGSDLHTFVQHVLIFEIALSKISIGGNRDPQTIFNSKKYEAFMETFDVQNFWREVLDLKQNENSYIMYENPELMTFIKNLLLQTKDWSMVQDYLVLCLFRKVGIYTSIWQSFEKIMSVGPNSKQLFTDMMYDTFGYYLELIYETLSKDKITKSKKNKTYEMFLNMKDYCLSVFKKSHAYSSKTRTEAIAKLQTLDIIIGKQAYRPDFELFPSVGKDFYHNLFSIKTFHLDQAFQMVGKPINRRCLSFDQSIFSFIVNAYYDAQLNLIYVPTSILNDVFLDVNKDDIYNYGSLGGILGHEMMHCFDNYGSMFDHKGHLNNWWAADDYRRFNKEISKVRDHYATFRINDRPLDSDGNTSENLSDIGGLKLSLRTYIQKYMPGSNSNSNSKLSLKQKSHLRTFFERWTQTLRSVEDPSLLEHTLKSDEHAPNIIRVNAPFAHLDEYHEVFDVGPQNQNYLEPALRSRILD